MREIAQLTGSDQVIWIDGSQQQADELTREVLAAGELIELNQQKLPGCYLHRSALNDVARTSYPGYTP